MSRRLSEAQREALAHAHRYGDGPFGVSYPSHGIDPSTLRSLERRGLLWNVRGGWYQITAKGRRHRLEVVS